MAKGSAGTAVIIIVTGGAALLIYSGLTGTNLSDAIMGKGKGLDPTGGKPSIVDNSTDPSTSIDTDTPALPNSTGRSPSNASGGKWTAPAGGAKSFGGPQSALLERLAGVAQNGYNLTITATTNGGHVSNSYHFRRRAFDTSGSVSDMSQFAAYVQSMSPSIQELIFNDGAKGYGVKNGKVVDGKQVFSSVWAGHADHVHVAA